MTENLFQNNFRRLNDIDENILNNNSFKDLDDKTLKLECIIAEKEEALEAINAKVKGAELLGKLLDVMDLKIQAKKLENEIADLKEQYSKRGLAEKLTDVVSHNKKPKVRLSPIKRLARFVSRRLIAMKVPYGETKANYEKLTTYLYRANKIHSQINKRLQKLG